MDTLEGTEFYESLKRGNSLVRIGAGARRVCFRIGDSGYCVKFMRDFNELKAERRIGWRFRYALKHYRFDRKRNLNCKEAEAIEKYREIGGPRVANAFPEVVKIVFDHRWGYGILMSYLQNGDGTPVISASIEMHKRRDCNFTAACLSQIAPLLEDLISCSAPFFEVDNFEAQILSDGTVRIRIIDFEPCNKKLIPLAESIPFFRRIDLRRRTRAFFRKSFDADGLVLPGGRPFCK